MDRCRDVQGLRRRLWGTAGLGLADEAVVGNACVASNGRPRLLLPVRSRAALADLSPAFALLRAACDRYGPFELVIL